MATITAEEAAELFQVNPAIIKQWCREDAPHTRERITGQRGGSSTILIEPESFRAWLIANGKGGYSKTLLKQAGEAARAEDEASGKQPDSLQIDGTLGLLGAVNRVRAAERAAFSKYLEARNRNDMVGEQARLQLYVETCKAMKNLESIVDERAIVEKQIWEQIQRLWHDWLDGVRSFVDSSPNALAARVNPADPALAETALRDWVNTQLLPMMSRPIKNG